MSEGTLIGSTCRACGAPLSPEDLACPACGQIVHIPVLNALSAQAMILEETQPAEAARLWNRALSLLPVDSPQAQLIRHRIDALAPGSPSGASRFLSQPPSRSAAAVKTLVSLLFSFAIYSFFFWYAGDFDAKNAIAFGGGFVLLILVHEMGHVIAIRHYGVAASPPIFIPFVGAVINIGPPRNALEESVVGIGGPALGTVGALVCFQIYRMFPHSVLLQLSYWGFFVNLFNLLPVPPLDGGRITAAVSPWFWPLGLVAMAGLLVARYMQYGFVNPILLFVLVMATPRIWRTFRHRDRMSDYYKVGRTATIVMGASYLMLGILLAGMAYYTNSLMGPGEW